MSEIIEFLNITLLVSTYLSIGITFFVLYILKSPEEELHITTCILLILFWIITIPFWLLKLLLLDGEDGTEQVSKGGMI